MEREDFTYYGNTEYQNVIDSKQVVNIEVPLNVEYRYDGAIGDLIQDGENGWDNGRPKLIPEEEYLENHKPIYPIFSKEVIVDLQEPLRIDDNTEVYLDTIITGDGFKQGGSINNNLIILDIDEVKNKNNAATDESDKIEDTEWDVEGPNPDYEVAIDKNYPVGEYLPGGLLNRKSKYKYLYKSTKKMTGVKIRNSIFNNIVIANTRTSLEQTCVHRVNKFNYISTLTSRDITKLKIRIGLLQEKEENVKNPWLDYYNWLIGELNVKKDEIDNAVTTAETQMNEKETEYNNAQAAKDTAEVAYNDAKTAKEDAEIALAEAISNGLPNVTIIALQEALQLAEQALHIAEEVLHTAEEALTNTRTAFEAAKQTYYEALDKQKKIKAKIIEVNNTIERLNWETYTKFPGDLINPEGKMWITLMFTKKKN